MEQRYSDYNDLLDDDGDDGGDDTDSWEVDEGDYAYNFVADALRMQGYFILASFGLGSVATVVVVVALAVAGVI